MLEHPKCLNNDKLEELGWRSAFEVYYGRKPNELVKCGVPLNREKEFNVQEVIQQSENLIYERQKRVDEEREKIKMITRKFVIGQLSTTGREESARNIRKEKKCLSGIERKTGKKCQNKDSSSLER